MDTSYVYALPIQYYSIDFNYLKHVVLFVKTNKNPVFLKTCRKQQH